MSFGSKGAVVQHWALTRVESTIIYCWFRLIKICGGPSNGTNDIFFLDTKFLFEYGIFGTWDGMVGFKNL